SFSTDRSVLWQNLGDGHAGPVLVPPGEGSLRVQFTVPEFVAPERIRFRCRMEGLETEWQQVEGARSVSYSSLPPGQYRFLLESAGRDGIFGGAPVSRTV